MLVVRFKAICRPERIDEALAAFGDVIAPSRATEGVVSFDIGRDLADPDSIVAHRGLRGPGSAGASGVLARVTRVLGMLEDIAVAEPEETVFAVSSGA